MVSKKPTAKTTSKKKATPKKPRAKKVAAKKAKKVVVKEADTLTTDEMGRLNLYGEIFWEYRAKVAEYEVALLEFKIADGEVRQEKLDPKYKELLQLISTQVQLAESLKNYANLLRGVQVKVASKLNVDIKTFLKECTSDHETGVVTIFD